MHALLYSENPKLQAELQTEFNNLAAVTAQYFDAVAEFNRKHNRMPLQFVARDGQATQEYPDSPRELRFGGITWLPLVNPDPDDTENPEWPSVFMRRSIGNFVRNVLESAWAALVEPDTREGLELRLRELASEGDSVYADLKQSFLRPNGIWDRARDRALAGGQYTIILGEHLLHSGEIDWSAIRADVDTLAGRWRADRLKAIASGACDATEAAKRLGFRNSKNISKLIKKRKLEVVDNSRPRQISIKSIERYREAKLAGDI